MNDSYYHKSVLYWPEPTIPISDHRHTIAQSQYVKGTMGYQIWQELAIQTPGCPLKWTHVSFLLCIAFADVITLLRILLLMWENTFLSGWGHFAAFASKSSKYNSAFHVFTHLLIDSVPTWHFLECGRVKSEFSVPDSLGFSVWQESQLVSVLIVNTDNVY